MPVALTYTTLQTALLAALAEAPSPYTVIPPDFAQLYPRAISFAESRIYAEIPLLANRAQDYNLSTLPGVRTINLDDIYNPLLLTTPIVVERIALITPGPNIFPSAGTRNQYIKTTLDFIDMFWPTEAQTMSPAAAANFGRYWAYVTQPGLGVNYNNTSIALAPTPDQTYVVEVTMLVQPPPLSAAFPNSYLSSVYPDLLFAACMIFLEGALQRNFGAQSDNPQAAMSWEGTYRTLKDACEFEEMRRRGMVPDQPRMPQPAAPGAA